MTKYGNIVLWMGLALMALQIAAEWSIIKSAIFSNSSGSANGGIGIPGIPGIPGVPIPPFLLSTPAKNQVNVGAQFPTIGPSSGRK